MTNLIYEASVYTRTLSYKNFKGEVNETQVHFALDPLTLMQVIAGFNPKTVKSGNPALNGKQVEISDEEQLKFIRDLAIQSAGFPSDDGESWEPFTNFADSLVGKAFLTKLTSSDGDRREFAEKVVLDPFRAFVAFAKADESNSAEDKRKFDEMLRQMERIFSVPDPKNETLEERKARLQAEMAALEVGEQ